jgi:hypothetical protein
MRTSLVLVLALAGRAAEASPISGPEIRVVESTDDDAITLGETTVTVDPDAAYQAVTDYARWSIIFPDIGRVLITRQQGVDARVTLVHTDGNRDNVHFHNQPAARMVWFEDTGGRADVWAEIVFAPGDQPGTTRVRSRLYANVRGVASLFVSDGKVRGMRQDRVRKDLVRLRQYFSRDLQASGTSDVRSR